MSKPRTYFISFIYIGQALPQKNTLIFTKYVYAYETKDLYPAIKKKSYSIFEHLLLKK